jgi:transposase, IS5 family
MVTKMLESTSSTLATEKKTSEPVKEGSPPKNRGKLILDATCAPGDISYPTDLGLLNQARKQTEKIIDFLFELVLGELDKKPRTYREKARKDYREVAKKRRVSQQ